MGFINVDLKFKYSFDKLFFKKSNYSNTQIVIADIIITNKQGERLITDESLVFPEYQDIKRKNNAVEFSSEAPIWSFFTAKFYRP